jgi:hypothetical protein
MCYIHWYNICGILPKNSSAPSVSTGDLMWTIHTEPCYTNNSRVCLIQIYQDKLYHPQQAMPIQGRLCLLSCSCQLPDLHSSHLCHPCLCYWACLRCRRSIHRLHRWISQWLSTRATNRSRCRWEDRLAGAAMKIGELAATVSEL